MPARTDRIKLDDPFLKRSVKLLPCQREMIHYWYRQQEPIAAIARRFRVSKRTVQFELFPERKEANKALREQRGGSSGYYDRAKQYRAIKANRDYKAQLFPKTKA